MNSSKKSKESIRKEMKKMYSHDTLSFLHFLSPSPGYNFDLYDNTRTLEEFNSFLNIYGFDKDLIFSTGEENFVYFALKLYINKSEKISNLIGPNSNFFDIVEKVLVEKLGIDRNISCYWSNEVLENGLQPLINTEEMDEGVHAPAFYRKNVYEEELERKVRKNMEELGEKGTFITQNFDSTYGVVRKNDYSYGKSVIPSVKSLSESDKKIMEKDDSKGGNSTTNNSLLFLDKLDKDTISGGPSKITTVSYLPITTSTGTTTTSTGTITTVSTDISKTRYRLSGGPSKITTVSYLPNDSITTVSTDISKTRYSIIEKEVLRSSKKPEKHTISTVNSVNGEIESLTGQESDNAITFNLLEQDIQDWKSLSIMKSELYNIRTIFDHLRILKESFEKLTDDNVKTDDNAKTEGNTKMAAKMIDIITPLDYAEFVHISDESLRDRSPVGRLFWVEYVVLLILGLPNELFINTVSPSEGELEKGESQLEKLISNLFEIIVNSQMRGLKYEKNWSEKAKRGL